MRWARVVGVVRGAQVVAIVALVGTALSGVEAGGAGRVVLWAALVLWGTAMAEIAVRVALGAVRALRRRGAKETPGADGALPGAVDLHTPVAGRWRAFNSPADKVPSHGTHFLAQTYAIDIIRTPEDAPEDDSEDTPDGARKGASAPALRWWPPFPANRDFPAFGAPVLAPAAGRVVTVAGSAHRDHRARNTVLGLAYLMVVEQMVRSVAAGAGIGAIVGNHVVLELEDGSYALFAHLRRGSATVREGDTVRAGQQLAECGNSGNSSEPHLHFQLMDGPDPRRAAGVPFTWRGVGVPGNGTDFTATPARTPEAGGHEADRPEAADPAVN
ncbi:M23 family metallopeptidase [Streptomyces sp. CMB-StM0423]|uniref:M23 family metallopeptidase n=1 Tax=Streptomyces sp. CMB-StM0423 TaxID=2059884 RepID=UPI000C7093B3|nr:M23 family metallopeptidase [Streptomyces sp. CMB-StM0423]AUH41588.1 M23 family peptidase [Streptomyces sp. CMB-StM0423]